MLLYPFEKQFNLPAAPIQLADGDRCQCEVVGQEDQCLARLGILEANSPNRCLEMLLRIKPCHHESLIADQAGTAIDGMRVSSLDLEIGLSMGNEEGAGRVKSMQTLEVEVAAIHDAEGPRLGQKMIQDVDLVHLAVADMDERRDVVSGKCSITCANTNLPWLIDTPAKSFLAGWQNLLSEFKSRPRKQSIYIFPINK